MEGYAAAQDDRSTDLSDNRPNVVVISSRGDVVLDVVFNTSKETIRSLKRSAPISRAGSTPALKTRVRLGFVTELAVLKRHSKYFDNLLSDPRFKEARLVSDTLAKLSQRGVNPEDADQNDLPWVRIVDDDEATRSLGREAVFGDLMRILHGTETVTKAPKMPYVAVLAVLADRFDCTVPVSRHLNTKRRFRWPTAQPRSPSDDEVGLSQAEEEVIRQKILASWLLDQPLKMRAATRELIMAGSRLWAAFPDNESTGSIWWNLPADLEREQRAIARAGWYASSQLTHTEEELKYRRECVLNTIASVLQHFLYLYTSRTRQCQLGYDSSAACDSYQLGEMVKFLRSRDLLYLVDFSPASVDSVPDSALVNIDHLLTKLKQCKSYQIDRFHTNCGLRSRILPILEYIQVMLLSDVVVISRAAWKKDRAMTSWIPTEDNIERQEGRTFLFARPVADDQRLRYVGAMGADRLASELFRANAWDWTPED